MPSFRNGIARLAWTILLGFVAFSAFAQSDSPPQPYDRNLEADILLGAARNAVLLGNLDTAIQRFQEFRKLYPEREDGLRDYAGALFQAGRVKEALPEYERLLKLHPNDPQLIRSLVDLLLNVGDQPRAKKLLIDAVAKYPDRVDFAISLALLYALDEQTAGAEDLVRKSIRRHPLTNARMRLDAAALYVQLKWSDEAGPIIDRLLKTDPNDPRVLALSVRYALLIGDNTMAVRQADKLDRLYPGNVDLRLELASALYAAGDYSEAGRLFTNVLDQSPQNATALIGCARVAMRDYGMYAADDFLNQVPDDLRGRQWLLASVERDTIVGDYFHAHAILRRLLQENPDDRQAAIALADLYRAENEFIKADAWYLNEGAAGNNSVAARHFAMSLFLQRRYRDAECVCRRLLASDPSDSEASILLARILLKTNRPSEAVEFVRLARTDKTKTYPECQYVATFVSEEVQPCNTDKKRPIHTAVTLIDLAMEDGRREWAKQVLDQALGTHPDNVVLNTRLAEWYASFGVPCQAVVRLVYIVICSRANRPIRNGCSGLPGRTSRCDATTRP